MMIRFMEEHPACFTVLGAPTDSKREKKTRARLRERLPMSFTLEGLRLRWAGSAARRRPAHSGPVMFAEQFR